ncbi:PorT family protein [Spirosoma sp. BT702]|uniref:PorT family protein n=1 Tax=Spirosoma profusum TaxID=2771354 RepID=A0A926Y1T3_9BACT|nr:PorT family protein [Spirosoma profusum]MBD2700475.1 PorT family protein [Spirosoma profusum]
MRIWILVWLLLLSFRAMSVFGQHKLTLSVAGAPTFVRTDFSYRYLFPDSDGQVVEPIFMNGERWLPGYLTGLTATYTWAPGWSVSSGIWYQQLTTRQPRLAIAGDGRSTIRYRTIRVPALLHFRMNQKRLSPYFSFGTFLDFPIPSRVIAEREGLPTQYLRLSADTGPIFHIILGAGGQYRLNDRISLTLQPLASYKLGRFGGAGMHDPSYEISMLAQVGYTF